MHVGIAGAGLLGRLAAWQLTQLGHTVSVFDPAPDAAPRADGQGAAAWTAAGMLSPVAEMENGGDEVLRLGWRSLTLWREITQHLTRHFTDHSRGHSVTQSATVAPNPEALFQQHGSLLLAHPSDSGAAERVLMRLREGLQATQAGLASPDLAHYLAPLSRRQLTEMEPGLVPDLRAWFLPQEGQVHPIKLMSTLHAACPCGQVQWHWGKSVARLEPGALWLSHDDQPRRFDWVLDVRGLGARPPLPLRGVRGEVVWLHAPGLSLQRPVRLLHPRHRVYLVPRGRDQLVIGASEIESEDRGPVTLRSAVELMAAAHSVLPELAESRVVHLESNLRPAMPDNHAHLEVQDGLIRLNGLFRHGWLLAPALLEQSLTQAGLMKASQTPVTMRNPPL